MTKRELTRQTPDCFGAKLLITSTALRAYRNRHLGTLMRCCEAWKPIEDCFDTLSFECIDFQRLSHIFGSFTRGNLATRETEGQHRFLIAPCSLAIPTSSQRNVFFCLGAREGRDLSTVTDEEGHPLENEDESGRRHCEYW